MACNNKSEYSNDVTPALIRKKLFFSNEKWIGIEKLAFNTPYFVVLSAMQTFEQLGLGKIVKKKGTYYTKVRFERTNMSKLTDTQMVTKTLY